MTNEAGTVFVELRGRMAALEAPEPTAEVVRRAATQIARPLGADPKTDPIIDALLTARAWRCAARRRLPATAITIHRFVGGAFTIEELMASGSLPAMVVERVAVVAAGRSVTC